LYLPNVVTNDAPIAVSLQIRTRENLSKDTVFRFDSIKHVVNGFASIPPGKTGNAKLSDTHIIPSHPSENQWRGRKNHKEDGNGHLVFAKRRDSSKFQYHPASQQHRREDSAKDQILSAEQRGTSEYQPAQQRHTNEARAIADPPDQVDKYRCTQDQYSKRERQVQNIDFLQAERGEGCSEQRGNKRNISTDVQFA